MSETKRPAGSARSPRKKPRSKSETATSSQEEKEDDVTETKAETRSKAEAKAPTPPPAPQMTDDDHPQETRAAKTTSEAHEGADDGHEPFDSHEGEQKDSGKSHEAPAGPKIYPIDEYLLQVHYDKAGRVFVATVLEFPEIKATGTHREGVVRDLENRVNNHLANLKKRNETAPEGYANRRALEPLSINVSQSLFRRLEQLSRYERVPMEQLISEMLAGAIEKRGEKRAEAPRQHDREHRDHRHDNNRNQQHNRGGGGGGDRDRDRENVGNQRHGGQGREGNRPQQPRHRGGRHNINETLDNRENFMEYVRNLEKGNWRKR